MAQANPTATGDFSGFLRPEIAQAYFQEARKRSTVMQLARQIPLGINGQEIPYSTSKATAAWVREGGQKPATESGLALKSITPHKIAAISVVSAEVVRANPGNYMSILRDDIAEAIAVFGSASVRRCASRTPAHHEARSTGGFGRKLASWTNRNGRSPRFQARRQSWIIAVISRS